MTFILGENEISLSAHKIFMVTSSPIFHQILSEEADQHIKLKLSQITKETMLEICRFAYTENLNLTKENMLDVLFAAKKFEMRFLMEKVIEFICKQMDDKTVFKILDANEKYKNLRINMKCFEYIEKNYQKCLQNKDFPKISQDTLRTLLTTCKIPDQAGKSAVTLWSKSNDFDDLDELLALISLNDVGKDDKDNSDAESVVSHASSKAQGGSGRGKPRQRNRSRPDNRRIRLDAHNGSRSNTRNNFPTNFVLPMTNQLQYMGNQNPFLKNLSVIGQCSRKNFKFANLDLITVNQKIYIYQLEFIYDLKTTDQNVEIKIIASDEGPRPHHKTLYEDNVMINSYPGPFLIYNLKQKVEILPGRNIWVRIEFPKSEFRITYNDYNKAMSSDPFLEIRKDSTVNTYAQIIGKILYTIN